MRPVCHWSGRTVDLEDGQRTRCPGCFRRVMAFGGRIRKHHVPASREVHPSVGNVR